MSNQVKNVRNNQNLKIKNKKLNNKMKISIL
jgi:hypothetical protein